MLRLAALLTLTLSAGSALACPVPPIPEQEIHLAAVNAERARAGRPALRLSPDLSAVAQAHACDMTQQGYFSHTSPDGRGLKERARRAGISGLCTMGENIGRGQRDVPDVVAGWMRSPGHRRNILDRDYVLVGFGRAPGPIWVQVFAGSC